MTLPFYELEFDARGSAGNPAQPDRLIMGCRRADITDLIFLAHGFRCDAAEATALYSALLANLVPNLASLTDRKFAIAGVYWPSQKFRESPGTKESVQDSLEGLRGVATVDPNAIDHAARLLGAAATNRDARDEFVASVLSAFGDGHDDPAEGLPLFHQCPGSELLDRLRVPVKSSNTADEGGIESIRLLDPVLGGIDTFLNFMSWSAMKRLAGEVGGKGLATDVLTTQRELSKVRIHLAGHSLGGRLMAACCKTLGQNPAASIASLSLLEAAFSHSAFSPDAGWGQPGFFRAVIESKIVRGPIISTYSRQDSVIGKAYAVASRLARDRLQAIGNAADPYGGIGHNGAQRTPESTCIPLHRAGEPYNLQSGVITCLDGSGGLIAGHGDITNLHVTHAIASAICAVS